MYKVLDKIEARGVARGEIIGMVKTLKSLGFEDEEIAQRVMKEYDILQEKVEEMIQTLK